MKVERTILVRSVRACSCSTPSFLLRAGKKDRPLNWRWLQLGHSWKAATEFARAPSSFTGSMGLGPSGPDTVFQRAGSADPSGIVSLESLRTTQAVPKLLYWRG